MAMWKAENNAKSSVTDETTSESEDSLQSSEASGLSDQPDVHVQDDVLHLDRDASLSPQANVEASAGENSSNDRLTCIKLFVLWVCLVVCLVLKGVPSLIGIEAHSTEYWIATGAITLALLVASFVFKQPQISVSYIFSAGVLSAIVGIG